MTFYDPPTTGYYVPEQARENGSYDLCRLMNGQVVQITWVAAEHPHDPAPRLPSAVSFVNIFEKVMTVDQYDNTGLQSREWNPWTYQNALSAARVARNPHVGQPNQTSRVTAGDAPGAPQRRLIYPIPLGVIIDSALLARIVGSWSLPVWQFDTVRVWLNTLPTNYRFVFVTNAAALGDAWLPPLPFGFQDEQAFWSGWNLRPPREGTTIDWHVTRANTALLQDRSAQSPAIANCNLRVLGDAGRYLTAALTAENGSEITIEAANRDDDLGVETLCVVNLDRRMSNHRPIQDVLRSIYGVWPRVQENQPQESDTEREAREFRELPVQEQIARVFHGVRQQFVDQPEEIAPPRPQSFQARQAARENLQRNLRGQRPATVQSAIEAVRMTALQHGHIHFEFEEFWPSAEHSNRRAVAQMTDRELWNVITYCVRERGSLHTFYAEEDDRLVVAECWIRDRPLFESLLAQAVARELAFADDVASFLRQFCASTTGEADVVPWEDLEARESQRDLRQQLSNQQRQKRNRRGRDSRQLRRFDIE